MEPSRALPEPCTGSSPAKGAQELLPAPSPRPARERTPCHWAWRMWVTIRCPPLAVPGCSTEVTPSRADRPRADWRQEPGQQLAEGLGPEEGSSRHPPAVGAAGPPCSEDAAGAPSGGASLAPTTGTAPPAPRGTGGGTHGPERGARPAGRFQPPPNQAFPQRDPSKGFSASTPHFDIPRLSQDAASKCLEFFFPTLERAFSPFPRSRSTIFI